MKKKNLNLIKYRLLKLTEHDIARARLMGETNSMIIISDVFPPANRLALITIKYVLKIVIIFRLSTCFSLCNSARWKVGVSFDLILIF